MGRRAEETMKAISKTTIHASTWEPYPMPKEILVKGDPAARVHWLRASGHGEPPYYTGLWTAEPSVFDYTFEMNETLHVLEGYVVVTQKDGPTLDLRPGDVATFPKGAVTRWDVREPFKKVFVDSP
jgi:uncharacterized cupin superfamily protein